MKFSPDGSSIRLDPSIGGELAVALLEPENPLNVGSIARTCACAGVPLHLVGRLGFHLDSSRARRAGLDYWELVEHFEHRTWGEFTQFAGSRRLWLFSTKGEKLFTQVKYQPGDILVFGCERTGISHDLLEQHEQNVLTIPMIPGRRSLNLSNSVAIGLYQAIVSLQGLSNRDRSEHY